jgi:hypothetical protein
LVAQFGAEYAGIGARIRYVLGAWHGMRGEIAHVAAVRDSVERRGAGNDGLAHLVVRALNARLVLMSGDTTAALSALSALRPQAPRSALSYEFAAALPVESIERARILLHRRRFEEAIAAATIFDHSEPIVFLPFVAESLAIRLRAARALRRSDAVSDYTERLIRLGRTDLVEASG